MYIYKLLLAILFTAHNTTLFAGSITHSTIRLAEPCGYKQRLLVIPGAFLPGLIGSPVNRIAVFKWSGTDLEQIPFQIDQRDEDNRYILGDKNKETSGSDINRLDDNDEFALLRLRRNRTSGSLAMQDLQPRDGETWILTCII